MDSENTILKNFLPQLKSFIKSETVFGEPYSVGEITLIPVNSVKVGFGFGAGDVTKKVESSAGGGGVLLTPVAFVVIKDDGVTIHNLNSGSYESLLNKAPEALDKFIKILQKVREKKSPKE